MKSTPGDEETEKVSASEEICINMKIHTINVDDEEECQRNSVLSVSRASVGEDVFDTVEQFGTMRNVKADRGDKGRGGRGGGVRGCRGG